MKKYVRPIWAAVLTASFYGCGHLYAGRAKRYFVPMLGLLAAYVIAGMFGILSNFVVFAPLAIVFFLFYFITIGDAYELVRKGKDSARWYSRWYVCAIRIAVALSYQVLNDHIRSRYLGYMTFVYPDPSDIMAPAVMYSDRLLVDTHAYRIQMPQAGDVVVVHLQQQGGAYIRRVMAASDKEIQFKCDSVGAIIPCLDIGSQPPSAVLGRVNYVLYSRDFGRIGRAVK